MRHTDCMHRHAATERVQYNTCKQRGLAACPRGCGLGSCVPTCTHLLGSSQRQAWHCTDNIASTAINLTEGPCSHLGDADPCRGTHHPCQALLHCSTTPGVAMARTALPASSCHLDLRDLSDIFGEREPALILSTTTPACNGHSDTFATLVLGAMEMRLPPDLSCGMCKGSTSVQRQAPVHR
jgi:hypothetical protein